jgi:serine/threonine protein kinase
MSTAMTSHPASASSQGVDRYRILDEGTGLGAMAKGSFGRVYVAIDTHTGITVAVKRQQIPSRAAARELAFYQVLEQCPHPNVMRLLNQFSGPAGRSSCVYMVFHLMAQDLWNLWKGRRRLLPWQQAQRFLKQAVDGVAHLHALDIVHTDLSMANMLIGRVQGNGFDPRGDVLRIADMGGAVCAHGMVLSPDETITTEYCRAPEIFLGHPKPTAAVDVWALGIVAVALLCGSTLFWRPEAYEPARSGLSQETPAIRGG